MEEKKKNKPVDLTLGAYHPAEKHVELADGTKIILEDPTNRKSKEEIEQEHSGEAEGH